MGNIPYYPVLEAEISKHGIKKKDIAKRLDITQRAFSFKMTGKIDWWWQETLVIHSMFPDVPLEKLFSHSVTR